MSQYIHDENDNQEQIASNSGYGDFGRWVDTLDTALYRRVVHLREYGWSQSPKEVGEQLARALSNNEPTPDVRDIALTIVDFCKTNGESEIVLVSDGMTS